MLLNYPDFIELNLQLAESGGFEPPVPQRVQQFSRLPHSTALAALHSKNMKNDSIMSAIYMQKFFLQFWILHKILYS